MDAADPLCGISSPAPLLPRTIGPSAASAASPSEAYEVLLQAISRARLLKGSKELVEQFKMVLERHGDIRTLYQDDGVKTGAPANGKKDQQGRRPGLDRKRSRFTHKAPERPSVDYSNVLNIKDPHEFFKKMDDLEEAEKEIRRLNGEVVDMELNFDPIVKPRRRSTLPGRKSARFFKLIDDADTQDPVEVPAFQTGTMTEFQLSQDDAHVSVPENNQQSIPSRSAEGAISDVSEKEDSVAEKDCGDDLTYLLTSLKNLDEPEEEDLLRKTLGIKKIKVDNSIPGVSLRSNTIRKSLMVPPPESTLPQSCQSRISELEKHLFPGDAVNDKFADLQEDDESEGSPDIVMGEQSMRRDSSDVLITDETFTASVIDKEAPNLGSKAAHHVSDPEPNMPDHADERQAAGSPLGLYATSEYDGETPNLGVKTAEHLLAPEPSMPDHADERQAEGSLPGSCSDTEVAKEKDVCSRSNICMEDNMPIDYPIDMSNNETEVSSCHLEGSLAEVLVKTPVRNVVSDAPADNIQHLEVVEEGDVIQDKSSHPLEIPLEDIDPANKKLAADLRNAPPLNKEKKLQAAQKGEKKQQSKRSKKVAEESNRLLEISQANSDSENRPHMDENIESLAADLRNAPSLSKEKKLQAAAQKGKKKQQSKRSKKVADESNRPLEKSQANSDSENRPPMDENIETVVTSNAPSPSKAKGQKGAQRRNRTKQLNKRTSLADAGLAWQSGVRKSTRIRTRPLEHWLGERFVFGRIHESIPTVIGIKTYSPDQDGKKTLKVKSFVPEQYSDLVTESAKS